MFVCFEMQQCSMFALRLSHGHLRVLNHHFQFTSVPGRAFALLLTFLYNISAVYSFQKKNSFFSCLTLEIDFEG